MIRFVGDDIECCLKANSVKQVLRDEKDCALEELSLAREKPVSAQEKLFSAKEKPFRPY